MPTVYPRRVVLRFGAASVAMILQACSDDSDEPATTAPGSRRSGAERHDVVVVGAGLAGLTTARALVAENVDVVVLEARDRVGGRTWNQATEDGYPVEAGGMWVGPGQDAVIDLAATLGIGTFANPVGGDVAISVGGQRIVLPDGRSPETEAVFDRIDALAATLPPGRPWDAPDAARLDATTLLQWLEAEQVDEDTALTLIADASIALGDPATLSMLWYLTVVGSAGGIRLLNDIEGGAQERRLVGGSQAISIAMADDLGDRVRVDSPVDGIELSDDRVVVSSPSGVIEAERVVVAMMPADVARVSFRPGLPSSRSRLNERWTGTTGIKATVQYPTPFWRAQGLSGTGLVDGHAVGGVLDITPPDQDSGWLVVFSESDAVAGDYEAAVIQDLTTLFGPEAAEPESFHHYDWATDPWSSGCVTALPVGVLTDVGPALRAPVGRIHWAGTETSEIWTGYMDGAVRSGQRAAHEVLAELA